MLTGASLDQGFWAAAVNTACKLKNVSPSTALDSLCPEEAWSGRKPDLSYLRVFGCVAYAHVSKEKRKKWDLKSKMFIFIGYCQASKAYRLIPLDDVKVEKVVFDEGMMASSITGTEAKTETETAVPTERTRREGWKEDRVFACEQQCSTQTIDCPNTVDDAMGSEDAARWREAMETEMSAHRKNGTWVLVDRPSGQKVITSRATDFYRGPANGFMVRQSGGSAHEHERGPTQEK